MAITRSGRAYSPSPAKKLFKVQASCSNCEVPIDKALYHKNTPKHPFGPSAVKIKVYVKAPCLACKAPFDQLLGRRTRTYWTEKALKKWAEGAPVVIVTRIVFKKKYIIKSHKGTTIKLRNGEKVSTLRIPNRWTSFN
jgi:hypothetical protein